ncbi:hypothetical protein D3C81_1637380 [compost metagenome]
MRIDTQVQTLLDGQRRFAGQGFGTFALGQPDRERGFGVQVTGLLGQHADLDLGVSLAQRLGQAVTGITAADDDDRLTRRRCGDRQRRRAERHAGDSGRLGVLTDIEHLEIGLAHVAFGAHPVFGDIFPTGAGGDAVLRPAQGLVVDQATHDAKPGLEHTIHSPATRMATFLVRT